MSNAAALYSAIGLVGVASAAIPALRAARLPAEADMLASVAVLSSCPVRSAERRARVDHISSLIDAALATA